MLSGHSFLAKLNEAKGLVGPENFLQPAASVQFLEANPSALLLDVQDPGDPTLPGAYQVSHSL